MALSPIPQGERYINFERITNARHLNGMVGAEGRKVRDNCFIRCSTLSKASDVDVDRIRLLYHVATVIDFRTDFERELAPDRKIRNVEFFELPVSDENGKLWMQLIEYPGDPVDALVHFSKTEEGHRMARNFYQVTVADKGCQETYGRFFDLLLDRAGEGAFLWHCTHGKDRTGLATLFLLTALGVSEKDIMDDFSLTQAAMTKHINVVSKRLEEQNGTEEDLEVVLTLQGANTRALQFAVDYVVQQYGGVMPFMEQTMGLTPEKVRRLRKLYLK